MTVDVAVTRERDAGDADEGGWTTTHRARDGRDRDGREGRRSTDERRDGELGAKWRKEGDGESGKTRGARQERREKYGTGGKGEWGKREGRDQAWGGKGRVEGEGKSREATEKATEKGAVDGGDKTARPGSARTQAREGIPTRPAGRGFTMGRGKSGGQALELSLGALQQSSVSDAFFEAVIARKAASGQFADGGEEIAEAVKNNGAKYRYSAVELVTILREMEAANACALPEDVCGTNVPLKTIKPGDSLWELTMLGRHGDWQKKKDAAPEPKTTGKHGDDVPEWAQEGNALGDASLTDDSFLGTALPQLTEEERRGLAGLSLAPTEAPAPQPPKTSRFVALEEEETLMPHLSHLGGMMQHAQSTQQQTQPQRAPHQQPAPMPPMHMPPMHMPPLHMPPQMQQPQVPPVPVNVEWLYLDPTGQQQGPFTRQELIEWHQGGFFPNDLPCKPADAPPGAPFMPLIELLQNGWRYRIPMQQPPPPQPPQSQPQGGLPPWLTQQAQQPSATPAPRGLSLEDIEQTHGLPKQQAPRSNVLANFAAGLGISAPTGGAPPQMRGVSLADLESRHAHTQASRQELASADASARWDAPPAARDAQPPKPSMASMPPQPPQPSQPPMPPMPPMPRPPTQPAQRVEEVEPPKAPSGPVWGGAAPAPAAASTGKTLLEIQQEEEARAAAAAARAPPPNMNTAFGGAWGGGAASVGKSLKEIQEEEARIAARRAAEAAAQQQQMGGHPSGGWAAAAASGIPAPKPASASPSMSTPAPAPRSVTTPMPAKTIPSVGNAIAPLTQAATASSAPPSGSPPLNNKKALRAWCKVQMTQLNNSDDMTLVDFLLGLPSAGEVQEYVALYLGKTPQAMAFAAELIRQKRADPSLAEGLGNGEIAKIAAQGSGGAAGGFDDAEDEGDEGWASAKKKSGKR